MFTALDRRRLALLMPETELLAEQPWSDDDDQTGRIFAAKHVPTGITAEGLAQPGETPHIVLKRLVLDLLEEVRDLRLDQAHEAAVKVESKAEYAGKLLAGWCYYLDADGDLWRYREVM